MDVRGRISRTVLTASAVMRWAPHSGHGEGVGGVI
jgi:hypothetical protein